MGLVDTIRQSVKLVQRGREHSGLCPFHNEKTPSFTVNEEKGFYHCFGCGAHGDVIGFVMRMEGSSFPEVVERLAAEVGLKVPMHSAEEQVREARRAELTEIMEVAADWYAAELYVPENRAALDYLYSRGLDDKIIAAFRLGFSVEGGGQLLQSIESRIIKIPGIKKVDVAQLLELGLLRAANEDRAPYPFFRNRIMYPITNRRGQVVAFGGRFMGDAKVAKYINSPDTLLFDKSRTLYNLADARRAAYEGEALIVAEGYMDVIALVSAGFRSSVAPLGTALTELQLTELWRHSPEPILCFDGDEAGRRAAGRAAIRSLPMLEPGKSLRFAMMRPGDDPDSLISKDGESAMQRCLEQAQPLVDVIWDIEVGLKPVDTPERRADLDRRLEETVLRIDDQRVRNYYRKDFNSRLWKAFHGSRKKAGQSMSKRPAGQALGRVGSEDALMPKFGASETAKPDVARRRGQQAVLATLVTHPLLFNEFTDEINALELDGDLDNLRGELQNLCAEDVDVDADRVRLQLSQGNREQLLAGVLDPQVLLLAPFAREDASIDEAREGLQHVLDMQSQARRKAEVRILGREMAETAGLIDEARVFAFKEDVEAGERRVAEIEGNKDGKAVVGDGS